MKSLSFLFFALLIVLVFTSCGKTTKSKFTGDWEITAYDRKFYSIKNGDTIHHYNAYYGLNYVFGSKVSFGTDTEFSTTMNNAEFSINKNGEWKRTLDFSYFEGGQETRTVETTSGTWSFLKKNGDNFDKNERVLFSVTKLDATTTTPFGGTSTISSTHSEGEIMNVFRILESKNKFLEMRQDKESNLSSPDPQDQSVYVFYSLVQKD